MRLVHLGSALLVCLTTVAPAASQGVLKTVAGGGPHGQPATSVPIKYPIALASGPDGSYYFSHLTKSQVFKVDAAGRMTSYAGGGAGGDGGPAALASLGLPAGLAVDRRGNLFIAAGCRVRRVDVLTGFISTVAGTGSSGFSGDGGPATGASMSNCFFGDIAALAVDDEGNLFIADVNNDRVRRVDAATGVITTYAGPCLNPGEDVPAAGGCVGDPHGLAVDRQGNLLITTLDYPKRVRRVDRATGLIKTIAGGGNQFGSSVPATQAYLQDVYSVTVDSDGNIFIADNDEDPVFGATLTRIEKLDHVTGMLNDYAGNGIFGFEGDGGPASGASLSAITIVSVDSRGDLLIADLFNDRIRKIDRVTTIIDSVAGSPWPSSFGPPATEAPVSMGPMAYDSHGNLFIANAGNDRVLRVDAVTDVVTTAAGNGDSNASGDGMPATQAGIRSPDGIAFDSNDNLFIADNDHLIRRVDAATGIITTVAGVNGQQGYLGDGGPATAAHLDSPTGIAFSPGGDLFFTEFGNATVRRVDMVTGTISTVAGNGVPGFTGDNLPATQTSLRAPNGLAFDAASNLYIADRSNHRVRRVDALTGLITTVAGNGVSGLSGDGGPATSAMLSRPAGIHVDASGNILFADTGNGRVRRVDAITGNIETVAGTTPGSSQDGTIAASAKISPGSIAMTPAGELLFSEGPRGIRKVTLTPQLPGEVPDGSSPYDPGLSVDQTASGLLRITWGASCSQAGGDYEVYEGNLGDFTSHAPALCTTGMSRSVSLPMPAGDRYYLVVPRNDLREGSYGSDGGGGARPAALAACVTQAAGACGP